jgi:hypothetical protein
MKNIFVIVSLILFGNLLFGQQNVWNRPKKYDTPKENVDLPSPNDSKGNKPWFVYSDRSSNPVYGSAFGGNVTQRIGFGESLAVLDVNTDGSRLLVALKKDTDGSKLKSGKTSLGWMEPDKLLLWEKSIVDSEHNIDKKAMILFTIDAARQRLEETNRFTSNVPVFAKPTDADYDTLGMHQGLFQFFPIFKVDPETNFLLLGESFTLDSQKENNGLKGWLDAENLSLWSHRVAWEKNWSPQAIAEREQNKDSIGIMVLQTPAEARQYASINRKGDFEPFVNMESPYLEMTFSKERKPGPMGRFPILDITEITGNNGQNISNAVSVGVIGEVMDLDNKVIDIEALYNMTKEITTLRKVNIIFVIDATESMIPYKSSVIKGVKSALKEINEVYKITDSDEKNDFLFGCALYRDYHMQETSQIYNSKLSQDTASFFTWLKNNMTVENNQNRRVGVEGRDDLEEAMFYGIQQPLWDYTWNERQSNYLILIGDCGDHQDTTSPRNEVYVDPIELAEELKAVNMNMLAFQVHHKDNPAYDKYAEQVKLLIEGIGGMDVEKDPQKNNLYYLPEQSVYTGKLMTCKKQGSIDPTAMSDLISENIIQINEDVNGKIKNIAKAIKGQSDLDPWSTAKVINFFSESGFKPEDARRIIQGGMNQEYEVGYTVLQCENYREPNFQQVVLFNAVELDDVIDAFRDLAASAGWPKEQQRIRLEKALGRLFPKYFSGIDKDALKDLEVGALLEKITGLDFGTRYKNISLSKVTDPYELSDADLGAFVTDLSESLKKLEFIYDGRDSYPARVEIPGDTKTLYLYIPGSVFPHN